MSASVAQAAQHFRVSRETIRQWIRAGAPCVELGSVGRGHSARLNLDDVARWRAARLGVSADPGGDVMTRIEQALADVTRRDGGSGAPIHVQLGIDAERAATLLAHVHNRIARALKGGG